MTDGSLPGADLINRFSSRRQRLDHAFLADRLRNAKSYRRIAGYFRSSIFELVGEEIASIPDVRILCNSELDHADIAISKSLREQSLKEKWNGVAVETEALLHRERYRRLHELLSSGRVQIRVVPKDRVFIHGKAGVIELADGNKTSFLGSINETKSAFAQNYEILWEDRSAEGVRWVEEEFEALWADSYPLPDAIVEEVARVANRVQVRFEDLGTNDIPAAALAEAPIYRGGEQLQPWQRAFVAMFLEHREIYGRTRLLLADEVGLGKTLSMAASALVGSLLGDGPVLVLCPATLTRQWQVELRDRLGIPSAVWVSNRKCWMDPDEHYIKTSGPRDVVRCPYQIAIVSTGLIVHDSQERAVLLERRFGSVVLDEAHKARRRGGLGPKAGEPNNLLDFMVRIGPRTKHLILGTATPIQTDVKELWDLLRILNSGVDFVTGRDVVSVWDEPDRALPIITGKQAPADEKEAWEWLRTPLPPAREDAVARDIRLQLNTPDTSFFSSVPYSDLDWVARQALGETLETRYWHRSNPILRHTVLRRRDTLEKQGLLKPIAADVHPVPGSPPGTYGPVPFMGLGLMVNHPFELAYQAAEEFTRLLGQRMKAAGFMRSMLLQRICSSFAAGRSTAEKMLKREAPGDVDDEEGALELGEAAEEITTAEADALRQIVSELSREEARDPKLSAVEYFLNEHRTDGRTWLEHGCILFSQYYDTARWVGSELAKRLPDEPIAVYAGAGRSGMFRGGEFVTVSRDSIKDAVKKHEVRLVVATDAACEGLNLQTLGTLINIDLPWNPSRLEQRLGRIKRFGQARDTVDMLNLVYHETRDEDVYRVLSKRLKDKHDIFGGLPDTIEDDWIDDISMLEAEMDKYMHLRKQAQNAFELRYEPTLSPDSNRWELCAKVLSRQDVIDRVSEPW